MEELGFDNEKYLAEQTAFIKQRRQKINGRLYLECGGKLLFDYHATRVLPGFDINAKMRVFQSFKDCLDVIICINSADIERRKMRSDFGITYNSDVFKMIEDFASWGIKADKVVITRFNGENSTLMFADTLKQRNIKVWFHNSITGYPENEDFVVSPEGFGANPYIPVNSDVVIVTAPGPGSGKLATCLSQIYHEYSFSRQAGYAKYESFPIWNLPIDHPVNIAYEAATADLADFNQIDPFYLNSTGKIAVNYNRDIEAFPLLKKILDKITGTNVRYNSPTDMGVNRLGFGIINDRVVREAAKQEIIRRYYRSECEYVSGIGTKETLTRNRLIMEKAELSPQMRPTVPAAKQAYENAIQRGINKDGITCAASLQLKDGKMITAHNSDLMHASSALIINALKSLAGIEKSVKLIPTNVLESIKEMKTVLKEKGISLNLDETLICLAMSATENCQAKKAISFLPCLKGCEAHMSHIPSPGDSAGLRKLGINVTSEPKFPGKTIISF